MVYLEGNKDTTPLRAGIHFLNYHCFDFPLFFHFLLSAQLYGKLQFMTSKVSKCKNEPPDNNVLISYPVT